MTSKRPDDEYVRTPTGVVSVSYLERVAICMIDGGLSEQEARRIAAFEESQRAVDYVPGEKR
jgi:hypothetical protein